MAVEHISSFPIGDVDKVKVTEMGHVVEVMYLSFRNSKATIRKLDKDHYIIIGPDGEQIGDVKEFNHFENRAASVNSLRQTFRALRNLINSNVTDVDNVRFITLTYRRDNGEPMTDMWRLYKDFERFIKKLRRYCEKQGLGRPEYISVVEPQGSGAWHCHVLFLWQEKAPYLPNALIREMWGQGFVTVRSLRDKLGRACDNVGAYLTAYLGDLDIESAVRERMDITQFEVKTVPADEEGEDKYFLKGARLYLYPPGMNIFRASRGVKRPVEEELLYNHAKEKVSAATLTFQTNMRVKCNGKSLTVSKRYYNTSITGRQGISEGMRYDLETGEVLEELVKVLPERAPEEQRRLARSARYIEEDEEMRSLGW